MDELPQEVRVHVLSGAGTHLHLSDGYEHLVAYDLHLIGCILARDALLGEEKRVGLVNDGSKWF